jgi:hypothetical protein
MRRQFLSTPIWSQYIADCPESKDLIEKIIAKKGFHMNDLQQLVNCAEKLENIGKQAIVTAVIWAGLAQANPAETSRPPDRQNIHKIIH